eukprot:COSAG01_NODE_38317_length_491_cov_0.989796_2_plen_74_part_01
MSGPVATSGEAQTVGGGRSDGSPGVHAAATYKLSAPLRLPQVLCLEERYHLLLRDTSDTAIGTLGWLRFTYTFL